MLDFSKHGSVIAGLESTQDSESDQRELVREVDQFLHNPQGQWEPEIFQQFDGKPRYTFDKCNPIVDAVAGDISQRKFAIRTRPAGGQATKKSAELYDGLMRSIQSLTNADQIYSMAGRKVVGIGFAAWEIAHDWADGDSFDQDLMIRPLVNAEDRVWFSPGAVERDKSDAAWVVVLTHMPIGDYEHDFPDGSGASVGEDRTTDFYTEKPEAVVVGRIIYKKTIKKELILFSDGSVRELDEDLEKVLDELAEQGITESKRKEVDSVEVWTRMFDGKNFLTEAEKTVFKHLPIIPVYGNFDISDGGKVTYRGEIEKRMDAQRVYNYMRSRETEEVALSPRDKIFLTDGQIAGREEQLATMNTNADPAFIYNNVTYPDGTKDPQPFKMGAAQMSPALANATAAALADVNSGIGGQGIQQGAIDKPLSGVAISMIESRGGVLSHKYFEALAIAVCHSGRVLIDAIPVVYDSERQIRILGEDGTSEIKTVNQQVFDKETQQMVTVNDLLVGKYDVTCDIGPSFKNKMQEVVRAYVEVFQAAPGLNEVGLDIMLQNIAVPGMELLAERVRAVNLEKGVIPLDQLRPEEVEAREQRAQQQAQQGPSPQEQALLTAADAEVKKAEGQSEKNQLDAQIQSAKLQQSSEKLAMAQDKQQFEQGVKLKELQLEESSKQIDDLKTLTETLVLQVKTVLDGISGPHTREGVVQGAELITQQQDTINLTPETEGVVDIP